MSRPDRELPTPEGDDAPDSTRRESDHDFPSFKLLRRVVNLSRRLGLTEESTQTGRKTISKAMIDSPEGRNAYKDIQRLEKLLNRTICSRTPGRGLDVSPEQRSLLNQIEELVRRAEALRRGEPPEICLDVATSPLLNLRVVGPLAKEAFHNPAWTWPGDGPPPRVHTILDSPFHLANGASGSNDLDLIVTFAPLGYRFDPEPIVSVMATRCIIIRRNHNGSTKARDFVKKYRDKIEKEGEFSYEMLNGLSVASLAYGYRIPDFPLLDISKYAERIIETNSTLESHALVRDGLADVTFTHRDVLSENDIKRCDVIDLGKLSTPGLHATRLCLIAGKRRRSTSDEIEALSRLRQTFTMHFAKVKERYDEAARLKKLLGRFKFSYHTSFVPDQDGQPQRTWLRGGLNYEVSVPHVTRDVAFLVAGTHTFEGPRQGENSSRLAYFGRAVVLDQDSRGFNSASRESYLWRVAFFEKESASFHVVFSESDLQEKYLFGTWTGTSSYMPSQQVQVAGCVIFHQDNDVKLEELNRIVKEKEEKAKNFYGTNENLLNPWMTNQSISNEPWPAG